MAGPGRPCDGPWAQNSWWEPMTVMRSTVGGSAYHCEAGACLRVHGLNETAAANTAATRDLPLVRTKRGCLVYATKAARTTQARV